MSVLNGAQDLSLYCPGCGNEILRSRAGLVKVRTKVLIQDPAGTVRGVCRNCGAELPLPLELHLSPLRAPHLYVRDRQGR